MFKKLISLKNKVLFAILLFSFVLRVVNVDNNPPALYGDELTMVLDVNSILRTGYDTTGSFLPLNFSMGGGRPVGYGYFSIPFIAFLGSGALGIRMLSVLAGVGIVFALFVLGKYLFSNKVGLIAAFIASISPWDLSMSRGGFESHFALFLSLLMIVLVLVIKQKKYLYILSALSFGLSVNTYNTYKLTLTIFLPLLLWFSGIVKRFQETNGKKYLIFSALILILTVLLLLLQGTFNNSENRFLSINVFAKKEISLQIDQFIAEQRDVSPLNQTITKMLNNSFLEYAFLLGRSYLNNFSMDFLFLAGDKNPRQNMAASGSLYIVEIILILFALVYLVKENHEKKAIFLLGWLLIAPLATMLLGETHALRSSFMLPPLVLLSAVGFSNLWEFRRNVLIRMLLFLVVFGFIIQFIFIVENLYFISPNKYSRFWAYPAKRASEIAIQEHEKYNYVFLADRIDAIEFAYPVYASIDPISFSNVSKNEIQVGEYKFKRYGNIYLGPIPDSAVEKFLQNIKGSVLYIGPASDIKYLYGGFEIIKGKDGKDALVVKKNKHLE